MSRGVDTGDEPRAVWYALVIEGETQNATAARIIRANPTTTHKWKKGPALKRARREYEKRRDQGTIAALVEAYVARHDHGDAEAVARVKAEQAGMLVREVPQRADIASAFDQAVVDVAMTGCPPYVALTAGGVPEAEAREWQRLCEQEEHEADRWAQMTAAMAQWEIECRKAMMGGDRGQHARLLEASIPERYTPRQETVQASDAFMDDADRLDALSAMYGAAE